MNNLALTMWSLSAILLCLFLASAGTDPDRAMEHLSWSLSFVQTAALLEVRNYLRDISSKS